LSSINEMQILLKERLSKVALGKWIVGRGWDEKHFEEKRLPDRFDLDTVAPDNPVILYYNCGPVCVVNKKALELAEITKTSTTPEGGVIDKDPNTGELTGILRGTATDLVWSKIPEPSNEELAEATTLAFKRIIAAGITSIHWLTTSQVDLSILQNFIKNRQLQVRVYIIIPVVFRYSCAF